ncbi:MAG TPA: hypothetical protein VGD14_14535, partial [bacterium]
TAILLFLPISAFCKYLYLAYINKILFYFKKSSTFFISVKIFFVTNLPIYIQCITRHMLRSTQKTRLALFHFFLISPPEPPTQPDVKQEDRKKTSQRKELFLS